MFDISEHDRSTLRAELHIFSDAPELYDAYGHSKCSLIIGKSRLATIKAI